MRVEEYQAELLQHLMREAEADGAFAEDAFFEITSDLLLDAGELVTADRSRHVGAPGTGIRVDGYGGDPTDDAETLSLVALDLALETSPSRLTRTSMGAAFRRLRKFVDSSRASSWRNSLEETSPGFGLADLIATRWSSIGRIRLFLITNRILSERVDGREADEFDGRPVSYSVWDAGRLCRQASAGSAPEHIVVDLEGDFGGSVPVLPADHVEGQHRSYLAVLRGELLADIYDRWGRRLLERNVRVFLQARNKVNRGMRLTLQNEPSMFFAYNNGITATAEDVEIRREGDVHRLVSMRNFQIVNGGQTTASVHAARRLGMNVSRASVQMKLSEVEHEKVDELVPKISEYANSQNRVNAADFFSNHPFHVRVEGFSRRMYAPSPDGTFKQSRWFYERARGQYADARGGLTAAERRRFDLENPRKQLFTKTDLAKFHAVWEGFPHEVSLGAQKNFAKFAQRIGSEWEKGSDQFNEGWYRETIARAIVFRETERIVSAQPWYQGGYRANIVVYAIAKLAHDVEEMKRSVDFQGIWKRQGLDDGLGASLAEVAFEMHEVLVDPPEGIRNVTEWAKKQACWERARKVRVDWPAGLADALVTLEERRQEARGPARSRGC